MRLSIVQRLAVSASAFAACILSLCALARAQAASASRDAHGVALLQQSLAAMTKGAAVTDITLSGTARWTAGSDDETGSVVLKATTVGQSRMDLSLSGGNRSEVMDASGLPQKGAWSGSDGKSHPMAQHNAMTDTTWFYPAFLISRALNDPTYVISAADAETHNGQTVEHVTVYHHALPGTPTTAVAKVEHLSRVDLYLDSVTLLPAAVDLDTHADNNALLDIPVEVRFSNWTAVNGAMAPLHVQKYLNNVLLLDLELTSANFSTGLAVGTFTIPTAQ